MDFIGRQPEIEQLREVWQEKESHLSVVYGRRRVGKTRLVEEAFKNRSIVRFEGLEGRPTARQKQHFAESLADQTGRPEYRLLSSGSWKELLTVLSRILGAKPVVLFFDEFQWLAAGRAELVSDLKYVWDNHFRKNNNLHLILCGSISSFLVKKVLRSRALYGRVSFELHVLPLLAPSFVSLYHPRRSVRELVEFLLVVGGIPEYLRFFDVKRSTRLNIQRLCFSPTGYLTGEFDRIFTSHFGGHPHYERILRFLAAKRFATRDQIHRGCGLNPGGRTSDYLEELEMADFIEKFSPITKPSSSKILRFRISDPYMSFYFRFIQPSLAKIQRARRPLSLNAVLSEQRYSIWRGLAFEHLCHLHADRIAEEAGFGGIRYDSGAWFRRKDQLTGAQIDLLFRRADRVITVCEMKFTDQKIGKEVIRQVEKKIELLQTFSAESIEKILVTASEPTQGLLNEGYFTRFLRLEDVFLGRTPR